MDCEKQNMLTM